jgi:hypothetical protein
MEIRHDRRLERVLYIAADRPKQIARSWARMIEPSDLAELAENTREKVASHVRTMKAFEDRDPASLTPADVQAWIASLGLKASSTRATWRRCARFSTMQASTRTRRETRG